MRIANKTSRTLVVSFKAPGYDEQVERIEPGETGDEWLNLEDDDIITVEEAK